MNHQSYLSSTRSALVGRGSGSSSTLLRRGSLDLAIDLLGRNVAEPRVLGVLRPWLGDLKGQVKQMVVRKLQPWQNLRGRSGASPYPRCVRSDNISQ